MKIKFGILSVIVSAFLVVAVIATRAAETDISANGFSIAGIGFSMDKVSASVTTDTGAEDMEYVEVETSETLWDGVQTVDASWVGSQVFTAADCASFSPGDKIVVTVSEKLEGDNIWPQVDLRNGAGWTHFDPKQNVNITDVPVPGKGACV